MELVKHGNLESKSGNPESKAWNPRYSTIHYFDSRVKYSVIHYFDRTDETTHYSVLYDIAA